MQQSQLTWTFSAGFKPGTWLPVVEEPHKHVKFITEWLASTHLLANTHLLAVTEQIVVEAFIQCLLANFSVATFST